jgi:hypothetical protein
MAKTEVSTGPMHGVQAKPKTAPATGEASGPKRETLKSRRNSRKSDGRLETSDTTRKTDIAMSTTPEMRVTSTRLLDKICPKDVVVSPRTMNTTENPKTNNDALRRISIV